MENHDKTATCVSTNSLLSTDNVVISVGMNRSLIDNEMSTVDRSKALPEDLTYPVDYSWSSVTEIDKMTQKKPTEYEQNVEGQLFQRFGCYSFVRLLGKQFSSSRV